MTITYGDSVFTASQITDCNAFLSNSLNGSELGIDTLEFILRDDSSEWTDYTYGVPVTIQLGAISGIFYLDSVLRVGKYDYKFNCVSSVGLLDKAMHYGGIYNGVPASTVIADIAGSAITLEVDPIFAGVLIYGWLPIATRRDNLRQVLFSVGGSIRKDALGAPVATYLTKMTAQELRDADTYVGGDIDFATPATAIDVTEYAYSQPEEPETVTLFSGASSGTAMIAPSGTARVGQLVTWDKPMFGLACDGADILESSANYAVLAASSMAVLTGSPYAVQTTVLRKYADPDAPDESNVITVDECTLVTMMTSYAVATRVLSYYHSARTVRADLVLGAARPGDYVAFNSPWDDPETGFVQSMDICIGSTLHKASTDIVVGYDPPEVGNNYDASTLLTGSGNWTVPTGVQVVRLILIGGGDGGCGGANGENGREIQSNYTATPEYFTDQEGSPGGAGGTGGAGGKVMELSLEVSPGDVISFSCGAGGSGAVAGNTPGSGTPTTLTVGGITYSSADGRVVTGAVQDMFSQNAYGGRGADGMPGGMGGTAGRNRIAPMDPQNGKTGGNAGAASGGAGGVATVVTEPYVGHPDEYLQYATAGAGGGAAAYGNPGADVPAGSFDGVDGADSASSPVARAGAGGHGGGGGGGASCQGIRLTYFRYDSSNWWHWDEAYVSCFATQGALAHGGAGAAGADGGDGCVLCYYKTQDVMQVGSKLIIRKNVTVTQTGTTLEIR